MSDEKEMSFIEHLEELRWHILRAVSSIFVFAIIAFLMKDFVVGKLILGPSRVDFWTYQLLCQISDATCIDKLPFIIQSRTMTGQFTMHLGISAAVGLIMAFPYAFWEIWRFIKPGMRDNEKTVASGATFFVSLLFMLGILFGYYIITPISINFLSNYQLDPSIQNEFDIVSYVSTVTMIVLACGLMFQLPMVALFLSKVGLVTPEFMRSFRRHAIVVVLIVSAIITPPDVISQVLIALPLSVLYEISIFVSAWVHRKKRKEEEAERKMLQEQRPSVTPLDQLTE
jgi:sec-independent protein translocase protein TatC